MFPEHVFSSSTIVDAFGFADVLPSVGTAQLEEFIKEVIRHFEG